MKPLKEYNIYKDNWICYNSKLSSVACSVDYQNNFSDLDRRINELVQSFFHQWQFVIVSYDKLYHLLQKLNSHPDRNISEIGLSPYDLATEEYEMDFRSHSYLFIVSIKTYFDLFTCLVDIIQNQTINAENEMPDFFTYGKRKKDILNNEIRAEFESLRDQIQYPWISLIQDVRNKIVHRGYHLKPKFEFSKSEELKMQVYKGIDLYVEVTDIQVGKLFNDFMIHMPSIEDRMADILIKRVSSLNNRLSIMASFCYDGLINNYSYKETYPPE